MSLFTLELIILLLLIAFAYLANSRLKKLEQKRYECFFSKEIIAHGDENSLASLTLHYILAIQPHTGMGITGKKLCSQEKIIYTSDFRDFYTGTILHITWHSLHDSYSCQTEPYKMKQDETLGEVIARYCDHAWDLDFLETSAEEALERYIADMEVQMAQKDQESLSVLDEKDRLRRLRNKLRTKVEQQ